MTNIRTEVVDGAGFITIDRKERFNSLDVETARDLRRAGLQMARDESVRVVVLRGIPGMFCSGADLKYIRAGGNADDLSYLSGAQERPSEVRYGDIFKQILEYIHSTISEIRRAPKPFIAVVDGVAAAGGFGLAMACDLVIASDRSTFEWAYGKTGLTGAESSTFFLPRLVGFRKAMELLLMNPRLDAAEALQAGLITAVSPADRLVRDVESVVRKLAAGPTEALGIAKQLINESARMDRLDDHLDRELENLARIADGANFAEGLAAFFEKRAPEFSER